MVNPSPLLSYGNVVTALPPLGSILLSPYPHGETPSIDWLHSTHTQNNFFFISCYIIKDKDKESSERITISLIYFSNTHTTNI